ncbi:hypothetical protein H257_06203 [Aphanomyces astaci]|uniref:Uncharacterized protein n=1 Tax=Aphanomyces astaci TaxID=112090 RepID=W4GM06_APHAT|nr:hypothetical protein H257_06203 [Aphanomyces astaci]ETV80702.1 hypothetical protein H257_06203 [Aphanomyces astaci]|eukprot:XP_009829649.1 hypothetical protein H257_06203 [Aphanomyces astaci]
MAKVAETASNGMEESVVEVLQELLLEFQDELENADLVYRNTRLRWAAALRMVPKKYPSDLRMTIDSIPTNTCTERMPNLDVAMGVLKDSRVYFTLDWMKG